MSPACPLNLIHWPVEVGGRDFLGPKIERVAEGFVEKREDVAAGHKDLSSVSRARCCVCMHVGGTFEVGIPFPKRWNMTVSGSRRILRLWT